MTPAGCASGARLGDHRLQGCARGWRIADRLRKIKTHYFIVGAQIETVTIDSDHADRRGLSLLEVAAVIAQCRGVIDVHVRDDVGLAGGERIRRRRITVCGYPVNRAKAADVTQYNGLDVEGRKIAERKQPF